MQNKRLKMSNRPIRPVERERMRPWLLKLIQQGSVDGLKWRDEEKMIFEIPWRHGSRHGWNPSKDADLFERWAKHTGRYDEENPNPKRWKANFRCALNSLTDIKEIKSKQTPDSQNKCIRVYQFVDEKPREGRRPYKRRKISTDDSDSLSKYNKGSKYPALSSGDISDSKNSTLSSVYSSDAVSSPHSTTDIQLPDSTSTILKNEDFELNFVKEECYEPEIIIVEEPFIKSSTDIIERGVLYNHMSGFVMIQTNIDESRLEELGGVFNIPCFEEAILCSTTETTTQISQEKLFKECDTTTPSDDCDTTGSSQTPSPEPSSL